MLQAASEVTLRGLAKVTLLGHPGTVRIDAAKLGIDISLCDVVEPVVRIEMRQSSCGMKRVPKTKDPLYVPKTPL